MIVTTYETFVVAFAKLSPYEFDHFIKLLLKNFSAHTIFLQGEYKLRQEDLRELLTQTMQHAHIEIASNNIKNAKLDYELVKNRILTEQIKP